MHSINVCVCLVFLLERSTAEKRGKRLERASCAWNTNALSSFLSGTTAEQAWLEHLVCPPHTYTTLDTFLSFCFFVCRFNDLAESSIEFLHLSPSFQQAANSYASLPQRNKLQKEPRHVDSCVVSISSTINVVILVAVVADACEMHKHARECTERER
jgi:hypothetical protein